MLWLLSAAIVAGIVAGAYIRRHQYRPRSFATHFPGFKPMVASHRGFGKHGPVAENTVQAFLASEDRGFHAHELDVRRTRDNVLVLLHGPRLENTTDGKGRVEDSNFSAISTLNAAHYLKHQTPGKRVLNASLPTLTDIFTAIDKSSLVNVEIKRDRWDFSRGLEELVVATVEKAGAGDRVFLSGFHFLTLWRLRRMKTRLPVGLLIEPGPWARFKLWLYHNILLPDNIHLHHYTTATPRLVKDLKQAGFGVACWTVNEPAMAMALFAEGVDVVITDNMEFAAIFGETKTQKKR